MDNRDDRRTALLVAACRMIARRGVRGLRVEEVAKEAGTSTTLIYYYFKNRGGLLRQTMEFVNERAGQYTAGNAGNAGKASRERLLTRLLREFQNSTAVRENSAVWGELRAAAIFESSLRPIVGSITADWVDDLAQIIADGHDDGSIPRGTDPHDTAVRLIALVEGLSSRWLARQLDTATVHALLRTAVDKECSKS